VCGDTEINQPTNTIAMNDKQQILETMIADDYMRPKMVDNEREILDRLREEGYTEEQAKVISDIVYDVVKAAAYETAGMALGHIMHRVGCMSHYGMAIVSALGLNQKPVAYIARQMGVTRQNMHKLREGVARIVGRIDGDTITAKRRREKPRSPMDGYISEYAAEKIVGVEHGNGTVAVLVSEGLVRTKESGGVTWYSRADCRTVARKQAEKKRAGPSRRGGR